MMKVSKKGYLTPWSSRREEAGLLWTFLLFLVGFPSHTEATLSQVRHLLQQLVELTLVMLGLLTPVMHNSGALLRHPLRFMPGHHVPVAAESALAPLPSHAMFSSNSMILRTAHSLHRMTYVFEGKATLHGQPCPNASVLIRLTSGERAVAQGIMTDGDGNYSVQVAIEAEDKDPIDWTIDAYTPDFKDVEIGGRRIVQSEEELDKQPIVVTNPVEFVVSLSK